MYIFGYTMGFNTSIGILVTLLYVFPTFSIQEIEVHHDSASCSTGQNEKIREDPHLYQCGNLTYKISQDSCCDGVITRGLSQLVADCCKSKALNPLNEICCNGSILTRTDAQAECCGTGLYLPSLDQSCCSTNIYNKTTHWCDSQFEPVEVKPRNSLDSSAFLHGADSKPTKIRLEISECTLTNVSDLKCESDIYDPQKNVCCSGVLFTRSSRYKCCGKYYYPLYNTTVLCCNGILHFNVPENAECVGNLVYIEKQIQLRCGLELYNPHNKSLRCCSGHLHSTADGKAECCGTLLLEEKTHQTCCSSTSHVLLYQTKPNHSCCGHYYYNMSLWSCCAGHLKPTATKNSPTAEFRLKPLMNLIPDICNKTVAFGKVEGVALTEHRRLIAFRVLLEYSGISGTCIKNLLYNTSLDHCSSPALEHGMTYIWEKKAGVYNPLSLPIDPTFDINMFFAICMAKMKNNA